MITKDQFQIIREYFLSFNEGIRSNIRNTATATLLKYITIIETGFFKDENINSLLSQIQSADLSEDLSKLKDEYYLQLANRELQGEESEEINQLHQAENQTYLKIVDELSVDTSFEKDVESAIKLSERSALKKYFQEIDELEDLGITDEEIGVAITSVERKSMKKQFAEIDRSTSQRKIIRLFTQYAVAASLIGIIITLLLPVFKKEQEEIVVQNTDTEPGLDTSVTITADAQMSITAEKRYKIIKEQASFGFAAGNEKQDSIIVRLNNINKDFDSLKRYTYDSEKNILSLNIPKDYSVKSILFSRSKDGRYNLYININGKYYLITETNDLKLLKEAKDKALIDELMKIEFNNE
jgi:hypothetical protein